MTKKNVPAVPRNLNGYIFSYTIGFCAKFHGSFEILSSEQVSDLELLLKC